MDYESNSPHQHLRECIGNSMEDMHTNAKKERVKGCRESVKGMQVRKLHVTSDWLWYSPSKLVCISCENSRRISFCIKVLISLIPCNPSNLVMVFMKDPCRACQSYWSNLKQLPKVTKKINSMKATQIRGMALTMESFSCNGYQQFVLTLKSSLTHLSCEK